MSCLEIRRVGGEGVKLCEHCLTLPGPSRSGRYQVYLLGRPAGRVCEKCRGEWAGLFERRGLEAKEAA